MTLQIIELISTGNRHQLVIYSVMLITNLSDYVQTHEWCISLEDKYLMLAYKQALEWFNITLVSYLVQF
jgi:hypothetical protein